MPLLLGRHDTLAESRDGRIVGQVDVERVRSLLDSRRVESGQAEPLSGLQCLP